MDGFYRKARELTEEEKAIDSAIDAHMEAKADEKLAMRAAWLLYFPGLLLVLLGAAHSQIERMGSVLLITGVLCFILSITLSFRTRKKQFEAKLLVDPYMRKKALPFYNELTEMFASKPGIHLHLNDNGDITVTDKRKKEAR